MQQENTKVVENPDIEENLAPEQVQEAPAHTPPNLPAGPPANALDAKVDDDALEEGEYEDSEYNPVAPTVDIKRRYDKDGEPEAICYGSKIEKDAEGNIVRFSYSESITFKHDAAYTRDAIINRSQAIAKRFSGPQMMGPPDKLTGDPLFEKLPDFHNGRRLRVVCWIE